MAFRSKLKVIHFTRLLVILAPDQLKNAILPTIPRIFL